MPFDRDLSFQITNALATGKISVIYDLAESHGISREQAVFLVSLLDGYLKFLELSQGPRISEV